MKREKTRPKVNINQASIHIAASQHFFYASGSPCPLSPREMNTQLKPQHRFSPLEDSSLVVKLPSSIAESQPQLSSRHSSRIREGSHKRKWPKQNKSSKSSKEVDLGDTVGKRPFERQKMKGIVKLTELIRVFHEKLTCNSVLRKPVCYELLQNQNQLEEPGSAWQIDKMLLPEAVENIITFSKVVYIIIYCFLFPLSLIFHEVSFSLAMIIVKTFGLSFCLLDILRILQNQPEEHRSNALEEALNSSERRRNALIQQVVVMVAVVTSIVLTEYRFSLGSFAFLPMIVNIMRYQKEVKNVENQLITATHYEKYSDLIKVTGMNLLICHLLACFLISITFLNFAETWMTQANIAEAPWYQQYVWSYYFGVTIILTIGFGDMHAANHVEAFFIITISFFACVFFGYNINYIGNLINSIRQDELQKLDKLKVFGNLAKKTQLTNELKDEIKNYIIQESQIKKVSNYAKQKSLLQELPVALKSSYLQEANKKLFNQLLKVVRFTKRTIELLSENIETKICHPGEVIKKACSKASLIILQSGEVGFATRVRDGTKLNNRVLQMIKNGAEEESKLVCLDVISREKLNYDIKSLSYSVICFMDGETFQKTIRQCKEDFEVFKHLQDKCKYRMNEFAVSTCRFCNKKHTIFECPRVHFVPFRNIVPTESYKKRPSDRQPRVKFIRHKKPTSFEVTGYMSNNDQGNIQDIYLEDLCNLNPRIFGKAFQKKGQAQPGGKKRSTKRSSYMQMREVVTQIRDELNRFKKEEPNFQFTLWNNCDCDLAYDFKYYFPKNNPSGLSQKEAKVSLQHLSKSLKRKQFRRQITTLTSTF